jgi:hypothetical protein
VNVYLKNVENSLIVDAGHALQRPFDVGNWSDLRVGYYFSLVSTAGPNTQPTVNENFAASTPALMVSMGIKDSSSNLPGQTGAFFLGLGNGPGFNSNTDDANSAGIGMGSFGRNGMVSHDTSISVSSIAGFGSIGTSNDITATTAYCGFFGLRYVLTNRGLSNQGIAITYVSTANVPGNDYTQLPLKIALNNSTYAAAISGNWNSGGVALPIPTTVWFRLPYVNHQIRISCMGLVRYA